MFIKHPFDYILIRINECNTIDHYRKLAGRILVMIDNINYFRFFKCVSNSYSLFPSLHISINKISIKKLYFLHYFSPFLLS